MSDGATTVMVYKFTGDQSGAAAAIQELKARLGDINREALKFAKEAAKGNAEARTSLLQLVQESDRYKGKIRDLTAEVQKFQKVQSQGGPAGGANRNLNGGVIGGAMNQVAFGLDDAIQQYGATGRLSDALRGAGNNATMLASTFGPLAVVGTAAAFAIGGAFARAAEKEDDAKKKAEEYKKVLEDIKQAEARSRGVTEKEEHLRAVEGAVWKSEREEKRAKELMEAEKASGIEFDPVVFGMRQENFLKAKEKTREARKALKQFQSEQMADELFDKNKDRLKELYQEARAKGGGKGSEDLQKEVFEKARPMARTEAEVGGMQIAVKRAAEESERDISVKRLGRELEDPQGRKIQDLKDKITKEQIALQAKENAAEANRLAEHRKHVPRDVRDDIAETRQKLEVDQNQLKVLEDIRDELKKKREEDATRQPRPQGLGGAPP